MLTTRWILFAAFLASAAPASAETVTLDQFGGKADGMTDNGPAFARAFEYARTHPDTTLHLGGVCRIRTAQVTEKRLGGFAQTGAGGTGVSGLTIEDGTILLSGPFCAFKFDHCPKLTFRRVVFDYDPPIISQGKVIRTDRAHIAMTVVPEPRYLSPADPIFSTGDWFTVHKPNGDYAWFFVGFVKSATPGANGEVTLNYDRADMAAAVEGQADLRYYRVQRAFGHLLTFHFCDGVHIEDCEFHASSAFVTLFLSCNDAVLTGNKICPVADRLMATSADGFDFIAARRGPRLENNFFDRLQDDNIVISLRGNKIKSHDGAQIQLAAQSCTWYAPGDTIEVLSPLEGVRRDYKIVSMAAQKNDFLAPPLTLDRPLEGAIVTDGGDFPTLVWNKSWRMDGTVIRHNTFQNTRRYAVFMGAGGVDIEDNTISATTGAGLLLSYTEDLKSGRGELHYYPSDHVVVKGNTITRAFDNGEEGRDFDTTTSGAIALFDIPLDHLHLDGLHWTSNLDIENNIITDSGVAGISLVATNGATIAGNTITRSNTHKTIQRYGIWTRGVANLNLGKNTIDGANLDAPVQVDP